MDDFKLNKFVASFNNRSQVKLTCQNYMINNQYTLECMIAVSS
jgi:hypothetical protein